MSSAKKILAVVLVLASVALPALVYVNAQALSDWWALRGYSPPANIAQLAAQDIMLSYTKHLFYVNHPQLISDITAFRQNCPENTQTIVLGCYHEGDKGIFIFNVQDPALYGMQQVTAAHEVLHAVYARLSSKDKNALNNELEDFYKNGLHDSRVLDEVKLYQQTEPDSVMDEMSCTFGTELASLPAALETYYSHYFSNRQAIVGFEQRYESEFTSREDQIKADDAQLAQQKVQIDALEQSLNAQLSQINSDRARLDSLRASGQIAAYNSQVAAFNSEVDSYNAGVDQLRNIISDYNQLVNTRNAIASDLASLDKAIDTRLVPQTTK